MARAAAGLVFQDMVILVRQTAAWATEVVLVAEAVAEAVAGAVAGAVVEAEVVVGKVKNQRQSRWRHLFAAQRRMSGSGCFSKMATHPPGPFRPFEQSVDRLTPNHGAAIRN